MPLGELISRFRPDIKRARVKALRAARRLGQEAAYAAIALSSPGPELAQKLKAFNPDKRDPGLEAAFNQGYDQTSEE